MVAVFDVGAGDIGVWKSGFDFVWGVGEDVFVLVALEEVDGESEFGHFAGEDHVVFGFLVEGEGEMVGVVAVVVGDGGEAVGVDFCCLLYTSDAADE